MEMAFSRGKANNSAAAGAIVFIHLFSDYATQKEG